MLPLEGEAANPLIPHHFEEIGIGVVLMLLIWLVMWKVVVPKFEANYAARREAIEGGLELAEKAQLEAKAARDEHEAQLVQARTEAAKIREQAKNEGAEILAEMRDQAQSEADRIVTNARAQLEAERVKVTRELRAEVGGLATTLAGRIVGESLDDEDRVHRTVDRFLAELEQESAVAGAGSAERS